MSNRVPDWTPLEKYDIDELGKAQRKLLDHRFSGDLGPLEFLRHLFLEKYSYDIAGGTGPYLAVVLRVLSDGETKTASNITALKSTYSELSANMSGKEKVRVIARVPRLDVDLPLPKPEDEMGIGIHAESVERDDGPEIKNLKPGSLIYVQYENEELKTCSDGLPAGKIIAVVDSTGFSSVSKKASSADQFSPECKAARTLAGPGGGLYVGKTEADPNSNPGPLVEKIKNKIKTGMYGNGTPQTKAHFDQCLKNSHASTKNKIPGPAPDSKSAFVWIGNLKNNGYLDLLDRPVGQGRETIIYAPMNLDLNAPIEIKYYFHDKSGFGRSWTKGPDTTVEQAKSEALLTNDFKNKIGPAIKDLIRDRRNFVLVIPELAHSRGFETGYNDATRIKNLIKGTKVDSSAAADAYLRVQVDPKVRPHVKEYLRSIPIEKNQNLLHITPLVERAYCSFDGSFSGGRFDLFHQEVLEVLSPLWRTTMEQPALLQ